MKLRHLIPLFLAVAGLFMACSEENEPTYLDQVRVSSSYVSIPVEGGATSITVTAAADWQLAKIFAKTIINATGEKETVYESVPQWLTVSQTAGPAGETMLTFEADAAIDGRTAELRLNCAGQTQIINVIQGLSTVSNATCAEVIAGPDSKTYRVTGTVTSIANTTYGNWYLNDGTGEIYIYGTLDAKGQTKNFLSLGLEVGDEVTVEGPKTTYNGTVELVDVTVVKINKSLIKVDSLTVDGVKTEDPMPVEGGLVTANLTCKGNGVSVDIPEDAKNWLSIASIDGSSPAVTFRVAPNDGGDRSTTLTFTTTDGKKQYTSEVV
ncbi:MAG: BACON domain-containing protein, partial [Prevotella sp.]|nr:BACON domain-containing protein [Prevotella sp.]